VHPPARPAASAAPLAWPAADPRVLAVPVRRRALRPVLHRGSSDSFDRFWRGRQASQVSGSGIGLAVAAEVARAHGGSVTAASELGQGTQMTLTLPGA